MTGRKTDMEMEDIRRSALTMTDRRALAEALETRHGAPEDKAGQVSRRQRSTGAMPPMRA